MRQVVRLGVAACALVAASGCSLKMMAVKTVADTLSQSGDTFSRDDDPELVRAAVPFALKTHESLLESIPKHKGLLLATCSGFTQYSYAFVQTDADLIRAENHERAKELDARALKLYLRGKDYCMRVLEVRFPGITKKLQGDHPEEALARLGKKEDVPLLYWSAASWGAAISLGLDQPDLIIDFPAVRALADRALALDETWGRGALHELMITLDSVPEALGGSPDRARQHFKRAVELEQGLDAGPYISLAMGVAVPAENRAEFEALMKQALAIDVNKDRSNRLVNILNKRRAQALLDHADALFVK